jgi:hypothetical protein
MNGHLSQSGESDGTFAGATASRSAAALCRLRGNARKSVGGPAHSKTWRPIRRFTPGFAQFAGIILLGAGCTMTPKYSRPAAPVPIAWPSGAAYAEIQAATNAPQVPDLSWQEFFTDENLRQLIELALANNRDLRLAALNVDRARAYYGIQRAGLLPTVDAVGRGSNQRVPADLSSTGSRADQSSATMPISVSRPGKLISSAVSAASRIVPSKNTWPRNRPAAARKSCWCRRSPPLI